MMNSEAQKQLHHRLFELPINDKECGWQEWQCTIPPSLQLADGTWLCSMHASMYAESSSEALQAVQVALEQYNQMQPNATGIAINRSTAMLGKRNVQDET